MPRLTTLGVLLALLAAPVVAQEPTHETVASPTPADVYSGLVAETMRGLLEELLVIGLFVVGVGHVAHGRREAGYYRGRAFRRRLVLLTGVVLFVTYNKLTYYVEWELDPSAVLADAQQHFSFWQSNTAALMVIALTPLDLMVMLCLAGMFLAVARSEYFGVGPEAASDRSLGVELRQLYLFTGAAHGAIILWWIGLRAFTGEFLSGWPDVLYHALFAAGHAWGYAGAERATNAADDAPIVGRHVHWYAFLTLTVYVTRLWWYVALRYT